MPAKQAAGFPSQPLLPCNTPDSLFQHPLSWLGYSYASFQLTNARDVQSLILNQSVAFHPVIPAPAPHLTAENGYSREQPCPVALAYVTRAGGFSSILAEILQHHAASLRQFPPARQNPT